MRMVDIIRKKREGETISENEIAFMIDGYIRNEIPDYQLSAFLMATYFKGMSFEETGVLTRKMMYSGDVFDLSSIAGPKIDKHSTGGVGDKVSIPLAPLVACSGVLVPMVSGRGLGHTGGTLDKLESISGFSTRFGFDKFCSLLKTNSMAMIGQTDNFVPADKKIYSLRDVTATVESVPLITASIMSKKLASGADGFVMDVKTGTGAFMAKLEDARTLAKFLVETGKVMGKKMRAFITDMNEPLGEYVGNSLEILESIELLKGNGEQRLLDITLLLGSHMLILGGVAQSEDEAKAILMKKIQSGEALERFAMMVKEQGGDSRIVDDYSLLPLQAEKSDFVAAQSGYISAVDTRQVGVAASILGAGRKTFDDEIDPTVGFKILKKYGEPVEKGEPIACIHYQDKDKMESAKKMLSEAYTLSSDAPSEKPLVYEVIE